MARMKPGAASPCAGHRLHEQHEGEESSHPHHEHHRVTYLDPGVKLPERVEDRLSRQAPVDAPPPASGTAGTSHRIAPPVGRGSWS